MISKFSIFPALFWAQYSAQETAIIWERGNSDYFPSLPSHLSWEAFQHLLLHTIDSLKQKQITEQSLVAYCGSHRLCGVLTYCAVIALGAKVLILNPAQPESQRKTILEDNGVNVLICDRDIANFSAKSTACNLTLPLDFSQPATLTLTSGSTGKPKAVVHSVDAHLASAEGVCELMNFEKQHSWLLSLPLFHVSGQGIVWRWLLKGATLYINEDKSLFFDSLKQVTHSSLVPTQLQRYLDTLSSSVSHKCLLGGTMIPAELIEKAQQYGITTFSGYGMTEMASTICAIENELENVGYPLKYREVKIENNEIWVKGKPLALGYWQKNQEIQPLVNNEGWFQTQDRGKWNRKKQLEIKGRLDNMFISGGENIQPEEIEQIIFQSNLVEYVFVLPIADREFGQRPIALLQFKTADTENATHLLKRWLSDKVEKFKQPVAYYSLNVEKYQQQGTIKISRTQLQQDLREITKGNYV